MKLPTITILALPDVDEKAHQKKRAVLVCTREIFPLLLVREHCFESERGEPGAIAIRSSHLLASVELNFLVSRHQDYQPGEHDSWRGVSPLALTT